MFFPPLTIVYNAYVIANSASSIKNKLDRKNYFDVEGQPEKLSQLKRKTVETDVKDDLKKCNPRLGKAKGTVNNCGYCSVAMEMRSRGYDVRARKKAQGIIVSEYQNWFSDIDIKHPALAREPKESRKSYVKRSYDNLCKEIEKCGEGTRGYVSVQYEKVNSGHAMFWKVSNGRVTFYDGQNKTTHNDKIFSLADPTQYSYARLDNLKLKKQITEAVISRDK